MNFRSRVWWFHGPKRPNFLLYKKENEYHGICYKLTLLTNNHGQTSSFTLFNCIYLTKKWNSFLKALWYLSSPKSLLVHPNSPQLWQVTTREVWWYQATWKENMTPGCDPSVGRRKTHENDQRNGTHLYYVWTWCQFHVCMSIAIFIKHHWTLGLSCLYTSS